MLVQIVVLFMLVLVILLVMLVGIVALPYDALRGGASSGSVHCGVFYIDLRDSPSVTSWSAGAALLL